MILIFVSSMLHQVLDNTNDHEEGDDLTTHKLESKLLLICREDTALTQEEQIAGKCKWRRQRLCSVKL